MPPPQTEPALFKHLREIADGTRPKPTTQARRHHYVPSFLLARWASPQRREGTFYELTVLEGLTRPTTPDKSAFERDLYVQDVGKTSPDLAVEALLAVIEQYSADPLKALSGAPSTISDDGRAVLAFFIAYQQARTPPGLAQHKMNVHTATLDLPRFPGHFSAFVSSLVVVVVVVVVDVGNPKGFQHAVGVFGFSARARLARCCS